VFPVREPRGRYGRDRDRATVGQRNSHARHCTRQAPVVTPSKTARYISLRVGSCASRSAIASFDTTTLTWGFRDRWSSSGMRGIRQKMVAQPLAVARDRRGSAMGGNRSFEGVHSSDKVAPLAVIPFAAANEVQKIIRLRTFSIGHHLLTSSVKSRWPLRPFTPRPNVTLVVALMILSSGLPPNVKISRRFAVSSVKSCICRNLLFLLNI
jgi:hypothetical protein